MLVSFAVNYLNKTITPLLSAIIFLLLQTISTFKKASNQFDLHKFLCQINCGILIVLALDDFTFAVTDRLE